MQKVEIDINKPLSVGDRIELHFKSIGMVWLKAAHIAVIEWRLASHKNFRIRSWSIPTSTSVVFEIEVIQTSVVTISIISAAIIGACVAVWLTFDKALQLVETPAGQVAAAGTGLGLAAAGIAILTWLIGKK